MSDNKTILAVVDDHPIVIEGMKHLLAANPQYTVLSFGNAAGFRSYMQTNPVDIVLLDILLPDDNGVLLCREIKLHDAGICVLGMSNLAERSTVLNLLQHGASGYMLKSAPAEDILQGIEAALRGEIVLSREIKELIVDAFVKTKPLPSLTKREKELLQLLAAGKTTAAIADELCLSKYTVDTYRKNLLQKFEVKNTAGLLMLLVQEKML